ncbi:N-acetylneuraminate synthase family protein [Marinitoga arctica]
MIKIGKRILYKTKPFDKPYIIAEAGVNHEGDIEKAKLMIKQAAEAGADAIKFQTYKAEKLASKYSPSYWDTTKENTKNQYELFKKYDKFWKNEYELLAEYSEKCGIDFMSTPFDFESADFLDPLIPAYKIASADITNIPFLKYIAKKEKPILLSTGASSISEIWKAVETIKNEGNDNIILLHCVLNYPTNLENANIGMIKDMNEKFPDYIIGYSDHTLPNGMKDVLTAAWLMGAQVIEKHFTFDKSLPGNDHYHAMDKTDLKQFVEHISNLQKIIGKTKKDYLESEIPARNNARRSLIAAKFIPKGKVITKEDIDIKRPGIGVPPELYDKVIGSISTRDINEDEIIYFGDFKAIKNI